ncbi:hypothetical protein ZWY2020_028151 [Hordeum vulgare]|nr:hypothetical protein ZWY2020_028151 [Hordeum vulgare]
MRLDLACRPQSRLLEALCGTGGRRQASPPCSGTGGCNQAAAIRAREKRRALRPRREAPPSPTGVGVWRECQAEGALEPPRRRSRPPSPNGEAAGTSKKCKIEDETVRPKVEEQAATTSDGLAYGERRRKQAKGKGSKSSIGPDEPED